MICVKYNVERVGERVRRLGEKDEGINWKKKELHRQENDDC